jgi:hypothetical protein
MTIAATKYKKNVPRNTPYQSEITMLRRMLDDPNLQMRYNSMKKHSNACETNSEEVKHIENINNIEHYKHLGSKFTGL